MDIYVNGILQVPGFDYVASKNSVSFTRPPARGYDIVMKDLIGNVTQITADGFTFLYQISAHSKGCNNAIDLFNDALKYYDNPAVSDVLERLRVVVELVKQDDPIRQR